MLATVLAGLLGLGSVIFYMAAFVYPEVHRRSDFLWGGLGLIYAAVLWFSSAQMTGLVLLGQVVAVALLLGLGWQTLTVRRQKTPVYQQTPIVLTPEIVGDWAKSKLNDLRIAPDENIRAVRLERRAVEDPAVLGMRLDPRRRPAYDYEFVEDGVAEVQSEVQQGELFAFSAGLSTEKGAALLEAEADIGQTEAEPAYTAPPSAKAEVVAVEQVDLEQVDLEQSDLEQADLEQANIEQVNVEPVNEAADTEKRVAIRAVLENDEELSKEDSEEASSAGLISEEFSEAEIADVEVAEVGIDKAKRPVEKIVQSGLTIPDEAATADEWADEELTTLAIAEDNLSDDWAIAKDSSKENSVSEDAKQTIPAVRSNSASKPGLLEMPIILVSWAKDVVVSLMQPKPSKPVIEIPRREPVANGAAVNKAVTNDFRYNGEPEPRESKREELEDDLEESNWID